VKNSALQIEAGSFGLTDRTTTPKIGDVVVVPATVTIRPASDGSVSHTVFNTAVTVTYKATQGKAGKASIAK
jgi:hypothetical protein